jgi:hypothetical protein
MKKINLEIRDGNGGVMQIISNGMPSIYMKTAKNNDIECSIIDVREGFVHLCL